MGRDVKLNKPQGSNHWGKESEGKRADKTRKARKRKEESRRITC